MNTQTMKDVTALRLEAKSLRRDARRAPDEGARIRLLEDAKAALSTAITALKRELRVGAKSLTETERGQLRELLSSTIGSLGGTYRDAKDFDQAITAYDEGNTIEETRRLEDGHLDSYNLVQRLVVRLLKDPALIGDPGFKTDLEAADGELDRQHALGRHDSWFLADVILIKFLRGQPANKILAELESKEADPSFYESTDQVISALLSEGLGRGGSLETHLLELQQMLQRRGGLKPSS